MAITRTPRAGSGSKNTSPLTGGLGNMIGQAARPGTQATTSLNAGRSTTSGSSSGGGGTSGSGSAGRSSSSSGSGGGSVSSSGWGCPSGATLVREPGGTGNLVCRWNHNGSLFAAQPKGGGGGGGGTTSPAPVAGDVSGTAPDKTAEWLQAAGQIFARDPQAMLAVRMQDEYGDSGGNALYGMLTPYADAANALYLMQRGTDASHGSVDDNLSWLEDYWSALQTPGARIDTQSALSNLVNAGADSPLHAYLNTGDPSQQSNRALQLIAGGVETGMSPIMAQSIMDRLRLERDRYLGESARGGATGSFIDYLTASGTDVGQLLGVR